MSNYLSCFGMKYGTLFLKDYINGTIHFEIVNNLIPTSFWRI